MWSLSRHGDEEFGGAPAGLGEERCRCGGMTVTAQVTGPAARLRYFIGFQGWWGLRNVGKHSHGLWACTVALRDLKQSLLQAV